MPNDPPGLRPRPRPRPCSVTPSWSAQADHPRVFSGRPGTGKRTTKTNRGWSACADHDGGKRRGRPPAPPPVSSCPDLFHCCPVGLGRLDATPGYRWVIGASIESRLGSGYAPRLPYLPPTVTPDLFRGPDCQAPLLPGFPRIAVRGRPGPRNKSGVTTEGVERVSPIGTVPAPKSNRTGMDLFRA